MGGRPSIAPEKLLRAMLLQVLYSVRSERQLMEQTQYNCKRLAKAVVQPARRESIMGTNVGIE